MVPEKTPPRINDVHGIVEYFRELGATSTTETFVRSLINRGELPHIKIGRKFYIARAAVDVWISSRERRRRS